MSLKQHLQTCTTFTHLKTILSTLIKTSPLTPFSANQLITLSSHLRRTDFAVRIFAQLPHPNAFVYNAIISALARSPSPLTAFHFYSKMRHSHLTPTCYTFSALIKASAGAAAIGAALHAQVFKVAFHTHIFIQTGMMNFYSHFGKMLESEKLFDEMTHRDTFAWVTIIVGYTQSGDMASAEGLFEEMPVRSVPAWNAMIIGYAKVGDVDRARGLFQRMDERDLVSWTSMVTGYSRNGCFRQAVEVFYGMRDAGVSPDGVTMATVIAACAHLGALDVGKELHWYVMVEGFELDVYIGSALVDMYAKCGSLERALVVFFKLREKNTFCWNAIIEGLAMHGRGVEAVDMFDRMTREGGIEPNSITFVSILSACTHAGLVEQGRKMFASMMEEHSIVPLVEHYGCMVDLLGRAGFLQEALELIGTMTMDPNAAVWGALLGVCKLHGNFEIGDIAGHNVMELQPDNSGYYMLLVNMYGEAKRWGETAALREAMNGRGVEKRSPGCSWIEMDGIVHEFAATDFSHPATDEICFFLLGLDWQLKLSGYVEDFEQIVGFEDC